MNKIKISDSEKRLLVLLGCLILLSGSYFLVFQKYSTRAQEVETQNVTDAATVQRYEMMVSRREEVEKQTADAKQTVEDIKKEYPADVTTEKIITAIQDIENHTGVQMTAINFNNGNLVGRLSDLAASDNTAAATDSTETASDDAVVDGTSDVEGTTDTQTAQTAESPVSVDDPTGYYAEISMNYEASYADFKRMMSYINELEDRTTIPEVSASYDETTGKLTGVISIHMYYLSGAGREYEKPEINGISSGTSDIFRSGGGSAVRNTTDAVDSPDGNGGDADGEEKTE